METYIEIFKDEMAQGLVFALKKSNMCVEKKGVGVKLLKKCSWAHGGS